MNKNMVLILLLVMACSSPAQGVSWIKNPFETGQDPDLVQGQPLEESAPALELQGIWKIGTVYKAMIDDQIYGVGQKIDEYVVIKISDHQVILRSVTRNFYKKLSFEEQE